MYCITSGGAAGGVRDERLDDAVHGAPAGQHHHGLLVVVLGVDAVDRGVVVVLVVGVGVAAAVLVAHAGQLRVAGTHGAQRPGPQEHLLPLLGLVS